MRLFLFFILFSTLFSCREESLDIIIEEDAPVFNFEANIDGAPKNASAGIDDYYMHASYMGLEETNVASSQNELFIGELRDESDQTFDIAWQLVNSLSILESPDPSQSNLTFQSGLQGGAAGNEVVSIAESDAINTSVNWFIDGAFASTQSQTLIPYPGIPDSLNVEIRMEVEMDDFFEATITGRMRFSDFCSTILTVRKMEDENRIEFALSPSGYGQTSVTWDANMETNLILLKEMEPQAFGVSIEGDFQDCNTRIEGEIKSLDFDEIRVGFMPVFGMANDGSAGPGNFQEEVFVRMIYTDENNDQFTSDGLIQDNEAFFRIDDISDYSNNDIGLRTKKINAAFNLQMINPTSGKIIRLTDGVATFAVAIP